MNVDLPGRALATHSTASLRGPTEVRRRAHLAPIRGRLSAFDPHDNGITAARLALALTVVISHSVARGAFGLEPLVVETHGHFSLGFAAVVGFFALSGFLLARSRERTPLLAFVRNRGLRIVPGYWVALLFGALLAAPLGAALAGNRVELGTALQYLASNVALLGDSASAAVQPAFGGKPVNGSLWTLGVEALAYLVLVVVPMRWLRTVAPAALVLLAAIWAFSPTLQGAETILLLSFAFGVCAWLWRHRLPMSVLSLALGWALAVVAMLLGIVPLAVILIGYGALGLAWLPIRLGRDLSYGVYVFAYPIQQVLAVAGVPALGLGVMMAASIGLVLPLALASWTFVERPALSFRSHGQGHGKGHDADRDSARSEPIQVVRPAA
jgi:peptidoglycan/LPS O-acetylase OafA/YrhL